MSLKKVGQVKKDRFFRLRDLIVYGAIAAVVAVLFLTVFLTRDRSGLEAVEAYYRNTLAFSYDFVADEYEVYLPQNIAVEAGESQITVTFCTDGGSLSEPCDYNIICINKISRSVSVTESDCSARRDCVYTSAITNNSGAIICTPHALRIVPLGEPEIDDTLPVG